MNHLVLCIRDPRTAPPVGTACMLFVPMFVFICSNEKRHSRRSFDRLYDTLDMSVWIEKLTNRWPPIKNQPIKIQRIVWCRIIHRTIYILKMRHQNRDEFHQFQEYSLQIQNLVIVDHTADSGISLLRNTNSLRNYNVSLSLTNSVKWDASCRNGTFILYMILKNRNGHFHEKAIFICSVNS